MFSLFGYYVAMNIHVQIFAGHKNYLILNIVLLHIKIYAKCVFTLKNLDIKIFFNVVTNTTQVIDIQFSFQIPRIRPQSTGLEEWASEAHSNSDLVPWYLCSWSGNQWCEPEVSRCLLSPRVALIL